MIQNEYILTVDLKRKHTTILPTFVQHDTASLVFRIYDNGKPLDLTDFTRAEVTTKRNDGQVVIGLANIETNPIQQIRYEYMGNEMAKEGFAETTLTIFSENARVSIQPFKINIFADVRDAVGATEEFGILQDLTMEVSDVKEATILATTNANQATVEAQTIVDNTKFTNSYNVSTNYKKNNIVSFNGSSYFAKKDTIGIAPPTLPANENESWGLAARKGTDGTGTVVRYKDEFIASSNQKVFTLSNPYDQFQNRIDVVVGGVPQKSPANFTESSSTTFSFSEGLPTGTNVVATYFSEAQPLATDLEQVVNSHTTNINYVNNKISAQETELLAVTSQLADTVNDTEVVKEEIINLKNQVIVGSDYLVKEPFEDKISQVYTFAELMYGFVISNDANDVLDYEYDFNNISYWESGTLLSVDGTKSADEKRIRTVNFIPVVGSTTYSFGWSYSQGEYTASILEYGDLGFIKSNGWQSSPYSLKMSPNTNRIKVLVRNVNAVINPELAFANITSMKLVTTNIEGSSDVRFAEVYAFTPIDSGFWEQGTLRSTDGEGSTVPNRIRTIEFSPVLSNKKYKLSWGGTYQFIVMEFGEGKEFIRTSSWQVSSFEFKTSTNTKFVRCIVRKEGDVAITPTSVFPEITQIKMITNEITVKKGEVFGAKLPPFSKINIEATVPYRAYGLGL